MMTACVLVNCESPQLLFSSYFPIFRGSNSGKGVPSLALGRLYLAHDLKCFGLAFPNKETSVRREKFVTLVPVKRWQKTATLGAVFGTLSTALQLSIQRTI
jgi:hypothetical protein